MGEFKKSNHPIAVYMANLIKCWGSCVEYDIITQKGGNGRIQEYLKKSLNQAFSVDFDIKSIKKLNSKKFYDYLISRIFKSNNAYLKTSNLHDIHYNYAMVFFVTAFETFFKDLFILLVNENPSIKNKLIKSSKKMSFEVLENYKSNKTTLGKIIAEDYNFQNLDSTNEAYSKIGFDFYKLLNKKCDTKNRIGFIKEVIEKRHNIVHKGVIYSLSYKEILKCYILFFNIGLDVFLEWLTKDACSKCNKTSKKEQ